MNRLLHEFYSKCHNLKLQNHSLMSLIHATHTILHIFFLEPCQSLYQQYYCEVPSQLWNCGRWSYYHHLPLPSAYCTTTNSSSPTFVSTIGLLLQKFFWLTARKKLLYGLRKTFANSRLKAENLQNVWDCRIEFEEWNVLTIFETEYFLTCYISDIIHWNN